MEFSFDLGTQPSVRQAAPLLYASVPGRASALGNEEVVFLDQATGRTHVMTQQVLAAMDRCRQFKPLDEHVQAILATQPALAGQQVAVKRVLEGLATRGLLQTDQQLATRFVAVKPDTAAPFAGAFIRACNRPEQLQTLLDSLEHYEQRFSARRRYVVLDDSDEPAARAAHRRKLGEFQRRSGASAVLVDRPAWETLVDAIVGDGVESAPVVHALLSRRSGLRGGGAGMNLAILLSAGSRLALFDDDFALPLHRHPGFHPGLLFDRRGWAPQTYADVTAALAAGRADDTDPFDLHLALCGQRLGAIAATVPDCIVDGGPLRGLDLSRNRLLDPQRRVLATLNGHRGQSGAESLNWLFLLPPAARAGLLRDRETFLAGLDDPAVWHGAAGYTVSARGNYTPFCVDNSRMMPCTNAAGRGEDAMFAALAHLTYPDDVVIDTPFAIAHRQESARDRKATLGRAERPGSMKCLTDFVVDSTPDVRAADPAQRLGGIAFRLRDLAASDEDAIQSYLAEYLAYRRARMIEGLQLSLATAANVPEGWAREVKRLIEANARALSDGGVARLGGWPDDASVAECAARFRADATALADTLQAWPALWQWGRRHGESWLERLRVSD